MSKNLTRKGLALGALVALGSSVIAGPAYAIDPVSLDPNAGTAYTTILGETFSLKSQFTDAAQLANEDLKFLITDSGSKLTAVNGSAITLDANKQFVTKDATDFETAGNVNDLTLASTSTTGFSVTVQAWLDYIDNGVIDAGESVSAVRTVKFVKLADAGLKTTLSAIALDDTSVSASITFNSDVNVNQINKTHFEIAFGAMDPSGKAAHITGDTTDNWVNGSTDSGDTVDVDDATAGTKFTAKTSISAAKALIYVAQAIYDADGTGVGVQTGDPSYLTVSKTVAYSVDTPGVTASDNVLKKSGVEYEVRTGTKTVSFASKVTKTNDAADAQVAAAGIIATVTLSIDTIDANDTITAGSASIAGVVAKKTFTVTSNADGKFLFDVVSTSGAKGTKYYVSINVPGVADNRGTPAAVLVTYVDASIDASGLVDTIAGNNAQRTIVKGGAVSIKYLVKDTFGALVTGKYRLSAASGSITTQSDVVNGYATIAFTDASTAATTLKVATTVEVWDTATSNYVTTKTGTLLPTTARGIVTNVAVLGVASVASAVSAASDVTNLSVDSKDFVTGDNRIDRIAPAFSTAGATITGTVTDALGAAVPGSVVTIAAEGVAFNVNNTVYSVGSATLTTGSNGQYSFVAYSHKAGKTTFTVTSGAATKTVSVTVDAVAASAGTSLVVTAPASAVPGKSVTVSAKLTDKWGNAVNTADGIAFTSTGAGYYVNRVTETDATGVAEAVFITQPGDAGTVKFTVAYTVPAADADDLTTSASTVFAAAVVVDPSASVATVTVTPASTTSQAGRALDVTVKAVDASGAAVAGAVVALSSTGAGSLSAASVVTGAAGTATVKLVAGASDLGAAVVTATSNAKSGSATVEFGATDASVDIIGKRVYVTTEFAAGKRVTIYDNGVRRYSAIQTTDAEKVVMWNVKAGSHTIVVKISGASSDSVTFLVK